MKVFKFGGASVRSAQAVRNMANIIAAHRQDPLLVVVSAMGKTTNALEDILRLKLKQQDYSTQLQALFSYHLQIVEELFPQPFHPVYNTLDELFNALDKQLQVQAGEEDYNWLYDQVISFGELISTRIIAAWLQESQLACQWLDARAYIHTDSLYREAEVDWAKTRQWIQSELPDRLKENILLTQGFIGQDEKGETTTLGREGSDFTAAIFGYCLPAESVTIWKDVPGILNADPKRIPEAIKYEELSYHEAAEMTYYGASVIHPKTIKPLANKHIPLWVKSFEKPQERGTCIHECHSTHSPAIIFKDNQCLISCYVKDFTFINERNLGLIFHTLDKLHIKINMMQNSAISFSVCIDNQEHKVGKLLDELKDEFEVLYNEDLQLITVKNYGSSELEKFSEGKKVLLEQKTRHNYQVVVK
jgi:aspartate kinase